MCAEAASGLKSKEFKSHFDKWPNLIEWTGKYFEALSHFHAAESHEQAYEYGAQAIASPSILVSPPMLHITGSPLPPSLLPLSSHLPSH